MYQNVRPVFRPNSLFLIIKIYLHGIKFDVKKNDHKPLLAMSAATSTPPPRIERWLWMLYNFK